MSDKKEFTQEYADDVKKRFEKIEASFKEAVEFLKTLGHAPSK